jgi:hypothetical protein
MNVTPTWQQKALSYVLCASVALAAGFALGSFSVTPADAESPAAAEVSLRRRELPTPPVDVSTQPHHDTATQPRENGPEATAAPASRGISVTPHAM